MAGPTIAPYGSWRSPITSDLIVAATVRFDQIALDGATLYWTEGRPTEGGRQVVVRRRPDGRTEDVNPPPFNARTRVHEYGGGAFVVADGRVVFAHFDDQRLYREVPGGAPEPLTPPGVDLRFADAVYDRRRGRLVCVREDHTAPGEPVNTIVAVALAGEDAGRVLVAGSDFYAAPRLSPDGARLAWLAWNHPNMPWDGCELWVASVRDDGTLGQPERIAGGPQEAIYQPEWSPEGVLHFVSDRTGWWNLYRWRDGVVEPLCPLEAEFGRPHWVFGTKTYGFAGDERIVCAYVERGLWRLAWLDPERRALAPIATPYTEIRDIRVGPDQALLLAGAPTEPQSVVRLDLATGRTKALRRSSAVELDPSYISEPEPIEFPTEGGLTAYAFFYRPKNPDFRAPAGEKPPLLVMSHGGPTGATTSWLRLDVQFWTSRGIAVLDVNYGGSTGYGRAYRERLAGRWGIVDVDDCVNGARYLVQQGLVDGERLLITGGSAGGYTTLAALTFRDVFRAGASHFGVSDLEALAKETHKFESRYLDKLVGPYPERRDLYRERSPLHHVDRLNRPVIFFQGLEDRIVPPNQAELMVESLQARRIPVAYLPFAGEQHGFRRAENIKRAFDAELFFFGRVCGFQPADPVEPVWIDHLPA